MDLGPVVICVAPNGARRTLADHAALPVTPSRIAACAAACADAGASMIHLHVRDDDQRHVLDAGRYRDAMAAIREVVGRDLLIQATTEAAGRYGPAEQMALVRDLRPEAVSLALRELVPDAQSEAAAGGFFRWLESEGIASQIILYDVADLRRLIDLGRRGVVPGSFRRVLFVLGRHVADRISVPADLLPFLARSGGLSWMCCAFGHLEAACLATAAAFGGQLRVGFENNIHAPDGRLAVDNAEQVRRVRDIVSAMGRRPATPREARVLLGAMAAGKFS